MYSKHSTLSSNLAIPSTFRSSSTLLPTFTDLIAKPTSLLSLSSHNSYSSPWKWHSLYTSAHSLLPWY